MNFETGVIIANSLSIGGACAPAGPNQPATTRAASARIATRLIARLLSGDHPRLGPPPPSPPAIVSRRAGRFVQSRLEPPLEGPAPLDVVQRAPDARAEPRPVGPAAAPPLH